MKFQDWLPILTFVLGSIFSLVSESIRNRYQRDRDREVRLSERAALSEREQQDFKTKTLIELQDSLFALMSYNQESLYAKDQPSTDPNKRAEADIRSRILVVRVQDDLLRETVKLVLAKLMAMGAGTSRPDEIWDSWKEAATAFEAANNRIGQLLQSIY